MFRRFLLLGAFLFVAAVGLAAVTSQPITTQGNIGGQFNIPLRLSSDQAVSGLNGQLVFDKTLFYNPQILPGNGSRGFTLLGNEVSNPAETGVGRFNFVIYADPTATMNLNEYIAYFSFQVTTALQPRSLSSPITFSTDPGAYPAAASNAQGVSLTPVTLSGFHVQVHGNAVTDWSFYE